MDWNLKENRRYLLLLAGVCGLIPQGVLWLLCVESVCASLSPAEAGSLADFFVCQWIPFWLAFLSYLRLQKKDTFSLLPGILGSLIILSLAGRAEKASVQAIARTIPLILAVELSALLKKGELSRNGVLSGIAADRGMLRAFFFWSMVFPCVALISCEASRCYIPVVSPFLMLPVPAALLADIFHYQNKQPPTIWGGIGMLAMVPIALWLVTIGPMGKFKAYHRMSLGTGFALLFLLLIVYNMDRWKNGKTRPM